MFRKILLGLLLSLLGLVIGLIAVEGVFRVVEWKTAKPKSWSDRPPFYFQHEGSSTLQDYPYSAVKPADTFRIAVVGDSFTFAPYMQFTDAFPKQLERMLNLNVTQRKTQIINYGVPGYSTSHEVEKIDQALQEGADLIILQITLNDPELKPYRPIGIRDFNRFGARQDTPFEKKLFRYWHSLHFAVERLHNNKTEREYKEYFFDLFQNRRTREPYEAAMKDIANKAKKANCPLVAVVFPLFGTPLDERHYPFQPLHQQVANLMGNLKVPLLDLYSLYEGIPLDRLQVIPGGDRHPNEIAHRMAAETIYTWLVKQNLVPEELRIKLRFQGRTQIIKEKPYSDTPPPS